MITFIVVVAIVFGSALFFFWFVGERGRVLASTWAFVRESGPRLRTLHGYVYGRWTPQYIKTLFRLQGADPTPGGSAGTRWLAARYHGKVLTHDHARAIVTLDEPISRRDLEQIVPFPVARDIVLNAPPDVVAYECVCRHSRENPCGPTQVCMVIGKPMTDFVLEHQPGKARRLDREEAVALLEAEHARGHVHSAWFKDAMLGRFYAICNCCKCCCGGVRTMRSGTRMMAASGFVATIDRDACVDCGDCIEACPFEALSHDGNGGGVRHDFDKCLGCGVCEVACATGAVTLVRDERKGIPLDVRALA